MARKTQKVYEPFGIVPESLWDRQIRMAEWHRKDAQEIKRRLKPYIGKTVMLSGGGGFAGEVTAVKLGGVKVSKPTYYREGKYPYKPKKDIWKVNVDLIEVPMGGAVPLPLGKKKFSPALGSWKLSGLKEKERIKSLE